MKKFIKYIASYQGNRYSEHNQDVLALAVTETKHSGYFVEFGTMDGQIASNTYLLEKYHGWKGIVSEPAKKFHADLSRTRSCHIDHRAVTDCTGDLLRFQEMSTNSGMSGLVDYFDVNEMNYRYRSTTVSQFYDVETVSLNDLLDHYRAPNHIDYISMDTEGSEAVILKSFDFDRYRVDLWTIEHAYLESRRSSIHDTMVKHGYVRILTELSHYDDWYINKELLEKLQ